MPMILNVMMMMNNYCHYDCDGTVVIITTILLIFALKLM